MHIFIVLLIYISLCCPSSVAKHYPIKPISSAYFAITYLEISRLLWDSQVLKVSSRMLSGRIAKGLVGYSIASEYTVCYYRTGGYLLIKQTRTLLNTKQLQYTSLTLRPDCVTCMESLFLCVTACRPSNLSRSRTGKFGPSHESLASGLPAKSSWPSWPQDDLKLSPRLGLG